MSGQLRSQQAVVQSSRSRPTRNLSGNTDSGNETTPTSLASVMDAFQTAGSRRRAMTNGSSDFEYQRQRQEEIEAEKARQQRYQEKALKRKGTTRAGDIDAVLDEIKDGWEFVIEPDFNNVDLALQLLDDTSEGKDMESFRRTKRMLSNTLKGSVDKHYQAFAASLPHHASLLNHLTTTQKQISDARTSLFESKEVLGNKRADLVQLWSRGHMLEEMIKILDEIERLKAVPDILETLISEKRLLQAAILLVRSLKIINKPDMMEIGAVSDLRSYLIGQETALRDILVDELQSHLYLKSFWCESRRAAYQPGQQQFPTVEFESEIMNSTKSRSAAPSASTTRSSSPISPSFRQTRLTRFLNDLSMRANDPPYDLNDIGAGPSTTSPNILSISNTTSSMFISSTLNGTAATTQAVNSNPEADSFAYMETLLESLAVLGKLGSALDNVAQRLPGEVFNLVETTLDEVEERTEHTKRQNAGSSSASETLGNNSTRFDSVYLFTSTSGQTTTGVASGKGKGAATITTGSGAEAKGKMPQVEATSLRLAALESSARHMDHGILRDLFWTLYSKLDAVAQGLRVVSEVANRIGSFNNVDLALQLLDDTSEGKDMESFRRTKRMLSNTLKGSVDKHYQAFAASLPHHASLLNHLTTTQKQISDARTSLFESKEVLGNKRADLVQLWSRGHMLEEMIKILDEIERLKAVPDILETLISEKRLLQAAILLVRSLKIINKPDMMEIGAVSDLRSYLIGQETALRDILVDELQSHLYLKSFWCESRWAAYQPGQQQFPTVEFESEIMNSTKSRSAAPSASTTRSSSPISPSFRQTRLTRFLNDLSMRANDPPYDLNDVGAGPSTTSPNILSISNTTSSMFISSTLNGTAATTQAVNSNPEADSFAYMETLLESLAVLGKLGSALDNVAQRLPGEVFNLVETTLDEVEERTEHTKRQNAGSSSASETLGNNSTRFDSVYLFTSTSGQTTTEAKGKMPQVEATSLRLAALESSARHMDHGILRDLFWTLYSKLDAVAQGLRVVSEVANRIGSRRDFKDSSGAKPGSLFPLTEVWAPVQAEVRTLINDYVIDERRGLVSGRNPISSINEILREGRFSRDKGKTVFRLTDTDLKGLSRALKPHEEGLTRVLRDTMPGLVQSTTSDALNITSPTTPGPISFPPTSTTTTTTTSSSIMPMTNPTDLTGLDQHHRVLIKPDAFNVTVLFQPTLVFLDRVVDVLPAGLESAKASSGVIEEFVLKVYLPQLEEKVLDLFHLAVTGPESFQPDPLSTNLSSEPLIKASTQLMALINSLCVMLRTTPFHRENYCRLVLAVVIQFYQRCSDRFYSLTVVPSHSLPNGNANANGEQGVALGAMWAQKSEITPCLTELLATPESDLMKQQQLCRQQTNIEIELLGRRPIVKEDLIPSVRNLSALSSLYRSIAWFAQQLSALRARPDDSLLSPTSPNGLEGLTGHTPFTPFIPPPPPSGDDGELSLPLSREMALRFQALLKTYEQLSGLILDTLRIDLRCRAIYYLEAAMRHGNYALTYEVTEPDPYIVDLNTDLVQCDDITSTSLPLKERHYVFTGLGHLMEQMLISNARLLRLPNDYGIKKMMRNMLALQQSIKTLTNDQQNTEFERAKQYYSLYHLTPQDMLNRIREKQTFTFDEYKTMLSFQCGVNPAEGDAGVAKATDRKYNMYVIELHGLVMDDS
ncbi:putative exocyst complex component sec8 [Leucoagaricus sp. SymC.cos]|nr:putative exocyst complex component sec8 [Leucoagaricus sp. SymC.cos]